MKPQFKVLVSGFLLLASQALAQSPVVTPVPTGPARDYQGPRPGRVIGQPYAAVTETEKSQTLADGTNFERKFAPVEKSFRDSQGRTRRENYIPTGSSGDTSSVLVRIFITDPLAGTEYVLDPNKHTAHQSTLTGFPLGYTGGADAGPVIYMQAGSGNGESLPLRPPAQGRQQPSKISVEDLGTQEIQGLTVHGTKTTVTIPAGAQGNDGPFETVSERWFSKELNIYILIKNYDPRSGETTIRTTIINRSEPDLSLFDIPVDYTVTQQQ